MEPHYYFDTWHASRMHCEAHYTANVARGSLRRCCLERMSRELSCADCGTPPLAHVGIKCVYGPGVYCMFSSWYDEAAEEGIRASLVRLNAPT